MLLDDWASALELSCMWQMPGVREMAIKEILYLQNLVSADGQKDLLRVSTKLGIREIRDAAISALSSSLQPAEQIQLGIEFQVDSLLLQGYTQMVQAEGGIQVEHEKLLGRKANHLARVCRAGRAELCGIWLKRVCDGELRFRRRGPCAARVGAAGGGGGLACLAA